MTHQTDASRIDRLVDGSIRHRRSDRAGILVMMSVTLLYVTAISAFVLADV